VINEFMPTTPAQESSTTASAGFSRRRRVRSLIVLALVCSAAAFGIFSEPRSSVLSTEVQARSLWSGVHSAAGSASPVQDFSRFSHANSAHARLRCSACHRREGNSAKALWLGHRPCSSCHSQKFATLKDQICTICHATAEPKNSETKSLSALKSFGVRFDHAGHANVGCATCHKPAKRGVALSIPAGASAHTTCFKCHSHGAAAGGRDLSSCDVCHGPGPRARTAMSARAYKLNFSHGEHGLRDRLNCNDCHRMKSGVRPSQMTRPLPAMHRAPPQSQSCASCHNDKRVFGGDDFSDCKRCHQSPTFRF
jgi:c(7)-type cytochrome triheme protein